MKKALYFLTFIALLIFTIYGINNSRNVETEQIIKGFALKPYKYGLYISPAQGTYYNFSPYDFYLKYEDTTTEKLVKIEEGITAKELNINRNFLRKSLQNVLGYFKIREPSVTFVKDEITIELEAKVTNNKIRIKTLNLPIRLRRNTLVTTLTFSEEDIIFDTDKNLYYPSKIDKVKEFTELNKITLKETEDTNGVIPATQPLIVANTTHNGAILIDPNNPRYEKIVVNNKNKLIEFHMRPNETEISIEVFESLKELL